MLRPFPCCGRAEDLQLLTPSGARVSVGSLVQGRPVVVGLLRHLG